MAEAVLSPSPSGDGEKGVEGDEPKIPHSRFKEVNDKLKAYAELGEPEQIAALIDQHAQLTEALRRQEQKAPEPKPTSPKSKIPEEKRAEILQQLNDVLGFDLSAHPITRHLHTCNPRISPSAPPRWRTRPGEAR